MNIIEIELKVPKARHILAKDISPWCIGIIKKTKILGETVCNFAEYFGFGNHGLIIMDGLKFTQNIRELFYLNPH